MIKFISTPSHGYLHVPEDAYRKSGYKASRFSYRANGYVFLEEDCDAPAFIRAAGVDVSSINETFVDHDITLSLTPMSGHGYVSPFAEVS